MGSEAERAAEPICLVPGPSFRLGPTWRFGAEGEKGNVWSFTEAIGDGHKNNAVASAGRDAVSVGQPSAESLRSGVLVEDTTEGRESV